MRVLLSTIGSRGDVQPLLALAVELRAHGAESRVVAPPDFRDLVEGLGFEFVPIGPEVRRTATAAPGTPSAKPTPEQVRRLAAATVAGQFATLPEAARGCDLIVGATALQLAGGSVAERLGLPYVYVSYCPATLPNPHLAPPQLSVEERRPADNRTLWARDAERWNATWGAALNEQRAALGLAPVRDVRGHLLTDRPWLAADPVLGPWPEPAELEVVQTGAWILPDRRPLPAALEEFLQAGTPPVYFGFGSGRVPPGLGQAIAGAARALGRRAIVARGWAGLDLVDAGPDCFAVSEVNQQALFPRVAAVAHHGGAGTTTAAAMAGTPQVVLPRLYDQPYWAGRVEALGVGAAHRAAAPTAESLAAALDRALRAETGERARAVAAETRADGVSTAARLLLDLV